MLKMVATGEGWAGGAMTTTPKRSNPRTLSMKGKEERSSVLGS